MSVDCIPGMALGKIASRGTACPLRRRLKVLSAGAVELRCYRLRPEIRARDRRADRIHLRDIGAVQKRLANGETADMVIGTAPAILQMEQASVLVAGRRAALGRTLTGVCVRDGATMPDISTPDRFRQTMLDAPSLAYTDPSAGGTSGIFLVGLLKRLGIADAIRAKTILCINGDEVVEKVLSGEAEIGSTFISEIVPVQGVKVVGPLPAAIENATAYAAGIMVTSSNREAAGRLIAMLTAPAQGDAWMSLEFEPAGRT